MNVIDRVLQKLAEARGYHVSQTPPAWVSKLSGITTTSGVTVNEETALTSTAVYACVKVLAETVASLPLLLYQRDGQGKERFTGHPLYQLLHTIPNPEMTSFELRETLMGHLALWGNAYAEIEMSRAGEIRALWPLRPDRMEVKRESGRLWYYYRVKASEPAKRLPADRIFHIPGFGFNGIMGKSPIAIHKDTIGANLAMAESGSRFFANDSRPGGVLKYPGKVSDDMAKRIKESWEEAHGGLEKRHRVAIFEEGMEWVQIGIPPADAQYIESRKFSNSDIARIYRVPLHMIADLDRSTNNNIEHQSLEFVIHTIRPWLVRWEQRISLELLSEKERETLFAEFLVDGLLRGDIESRYSAYAVARQNGIMNADEIRALENMNPYEGGDVYLVPLNMIPASQVGEIYSTEPGAPPDTARSHSEQRIREEREQRSATTRHRLQQSYYRVYRDVAARVLRRERNDVLAAAKKHLGKRGLSDFLMWLDEFYERHGRFVYDQFAPVAQAYGELVAAAAREEVAEPPELTPELEEFIRSYLRSYSARHCAISKARIQEIMREKDDLEALDEMLSGWPDGRAAETALWESVRFGSAMAKQAFICAGIYKLRWVAFGKSCPYCNELDGRVVGISESFLGAGEEFQPEGAASPLRPSTNVMHAPAHLGCLPGDSRVLTRDRIAASSERWYNGDIVIIRTACGNKLSCTPNHPILTGAGWLAAGRLNVGDDVISDRSIDWMRIGMSIISHDQYMPSCIHDVAESFCGASEMRTIPMPTAAEDFHGDGRHSEITVIRANRHLLDKGGTALPQQDGKQMLFSRNTEPALLAGTGGRTKSLEAVGITRAGFVGRGELGSPLFRGSLRPDQFLSPRAATGSNIVLQEAAPNHSARGAQLPGEDILGHTGEIFPDEIINIERYPFHGYVYNLQTENGLYVAEGIVVHNCDCTIIASL